MEINPVAVASYFLELTKRNFSSYSSETPTETEKLFADKLFKSYLDILSEHVVTEDYELEETPNSEGSSWSQSSLFDDDGNLLVPSKSNQKTPDLPIEKKIEILKEVSKHPEWSMETRKKRLGKFYKPQYHSRRRDQIQRGGTKFEKYQFIDSYTYDAFVDARKSLLSVKDFHLREWAFQVCQGFRDENFKFNASTGWITKFKQKHGISSRKITRLVSRYEHNNTEELMETAKNFQQEFRNAAQNFKPENVINTDQVGFTYEIPSNRTLSFRGEKLTLGLAKSPKNLVTHSYSIEYVISKAGKIVGDVFICLQEQTGRLGFRVQEGLFPASNVTITCSKSEKLTTSLFEYFLDKVVLPATSEDFLFLIDSWSGQTKNEIYIDRFGKDGKPSCTLMIIPKKCTPICQPLDTTFNRQMKYFARKICDEAAKKSIDGIHKDDEITTRNNIIRMHSLIHNQLSSPIFEPMIKYCWFSSGLTDEKPLFDSVSEACFTFESSDSVICQTNNCKNFRFLKCANCRSILCFDCFFYDYHFHISEHQ